MTQSHEPSYYEIALTNRQVLVVFVVLLFCVAGAFVAGVWVGQGGEERPMEIAQTEPADLPLENGEEPQQLRFFSDKEEPEPPLKETAERPDPDTSLLEDLERAGSRTGGAASQSPPPVVEERPVEPQPTPVVTPPVSAPPPASSEELTAADVLVIQVFSTREEAPAANLVNRLQTAGYRAFISPVEVAQQTMYRVRIGPFTDRAAAEKIADDVRRGFKVDTWITSAAN